MASNNENHHVYLNPAGIAEALREDPPMKVDDLLRDENTGFLKPTNGTRVGVQADALGQAAYHSSMVFWHAGDLDPGEICDHLATARGLVARLDAAEPRRERTEEDYHEACDRLSALKTVPHGELSKKQKFWSTWAKPGFICGDTAVMAIQQYRAGTPWWMAVLAGLAVSLSTVMAGTKIGREIELHHLRRKRRTAPTACPEPLSRYYDDGTAAKSIFAWVGIAVLVGAALVTAITLLGVTSGDDFGVAAGYGLLAGATLGGAAAAEGYGTNDIAPEVDDAQRSKQTLEAALDEFEKLEGQAADHGTRASHLTIAAEHAAASAHGTNRVVADPTAQFPDIFGYEHPNAPEPQTIAEPTKFTPATDFDHEAPRSAKRSSRRPSNPWRPVTVSSNGSNGHHGGDPQ